MPERQNDILVNLTAAANDLLPAGAPKHAVLRYTDNYASTGDNDSTLFADSWVTSRDGIQQARLSLSLSLSRPLFRPSLLLAVPQTRLLKAAPCACAQVYSNCTKPGGPIRVQMKVSRAMIAGPSTPNRQDKPPSWPAGCFLALGSGLGLVGTASARR